MTPLAPDAPQAAPAEPQAPEAPEAEEDREVRRGSYCISARAPADLPFAVLLALVDERPSAFEQVDDPRVIDPLDFQELDYDPHEEPEKREPLEVVFEELPLDQPLWLVVLGTRGESGARCVPSIVRELAPIPSADAAARLEIELRPRAALNGSWTALAASVPSSEDEEAELVELDLAVEAEIRQHLDARQIDHGSRFTLYPVPAGELEVALDAGLHADRWRKTSRVRVRPDAPTELATWYVLAEPLALTLTARSEDGHALEGDFSLQLEPGWSASEVPAGPDGTARLHGDWSALRRVRFTPGVDADFASTEIELSARHGPELVFICARKEPAPCQFMLIARLPNGDYPAASTLSWARRIGETNWRRVDLGYCSGCGGCYSSRFASGTYELCSWMSSRAASFEGRITLPEDLEEGRYLRLSFASHDTRVVCNVRATLAGYPACEFLGPQLHLDGETLSLDAGPRDASWTQGNSPMTLDLRGLPPGRSFTISLGTADGRALRRLPCKAREGGVCDLGSVVVSLD